MRSKCLNNYCVNFTDWFIDRDISNVFLHWMFYDPIQSTHIRHCINTQYCCYEEILTQPPILSYTHAHTHTSTHTHARLFPREKRIMVSLSDTLAERKLNSPVKGLYITFFVREVV